MAASDEIALYVERAKTALEQSRDNIDLGYHDVAATRAYYAMFYAATALLASEGLSRSKHSGVHSAFGQYFVKTGLFEPEYSQMLINAFQVRVNSDYNVAMIPEKPVAQSLLEDGRRFVARSITYLEQQGVL